MTSRTEVHVLGLGSVGLFAAHSLAESPERPDVTLLLHRSGLVDDFEKAGKRIILRTNDGEAFPHDGYNVEALDGDTWVSAFESFTQPSTAVSARPIKHLVLAVKNIQTVAALRPLKHRLGKQSSIVFLQNGSGMIEAVNEALFQDLDTRPNYITGVVSHGVNTNSPFDITLTGPGATWLGPATRPVAGAKVNEDESDENGCPSFLLDVFSGIPRFNATSYNFEDIIQLQLEKLTLNAVCNPNAALANRTNDCLLEIPETLRQLTEEISAVALRLPELQEIPGIHERFSAARLGTKVNDIIEKTQKTTGSMVCDVRAKKKTEVRLINGYWSRRGREVGINTPFNDDIVRRIEEKEATYLAV